MREKIALAVCALALVLVVALSFVFAVRHNPDTAVAPPDPGESNQVVAATEVRW
jgi:hypothetical protein